MERLFRLISVCFLICGCSNTPRDRFDGYAEGEFIYVSAPFGGQLLNLAVKKGENVPVQSLLFALDSTVEKSAYDEANRRYLQAQANFEDLLKGKRPSEIDSIKAQLEQAQATLELSEKNLQRNKKLIESNVISQQDYDQVLSVRTRDYQRVVQLKSDLETAKLGAREDQKKAADQEVQTRKAELEKALWNLNQKSQRAPESAVVFDTLFRQGEWVPAGRPVVSLLPANNIKVRTFIPEGIISNLKIGQAATITRDGAADSMSGTINYISTQAEFTPPVIYSRESRSKLVYLVEISLSPESAATLHPGQPVQVYIR